MFAEYINDLTICGDEAEEVFPNIEKIEEHPDNSFLATLRAIMPKRMLSEEKLSFGLVRISPDENFHAKAFRSKARILFRSITPYRNRLIVISLENSVAHVLDILRARIMEVYPQYRYVPETSYFLSQKGGQKAVFVSESDQTAAVIGTDVSISDWHYIQSVIPVLLPWYFTEPLSSEENAILHALTKNRSIDYINIVESISMGMDLRRIKVKKMLSGLSFDFKQSKIEEAECKLQEIQRAIDDLHSQISKKLNDKYLAQIMLCGIQNMEDPHDTELADFFSSNKALNIVCASKGVVEYVVTGYLNSFDQHLFDNCLKNKNSSLYKHNTGSKISSAETLRILKAIFSPNPLCKLRVYAAFQLKLDGGITPKTKYTFPNWLNTYLPHPHINHVGCLGGNSEYISQAMANLDYVTAVTQTMAAIRNINFADGVIIPPFILSLQTDDTACIEMRSGEVVCPAEAAKLLADMENSN